MDLNKQLPAITAAAELLGFTIDNVYYHHNDDTLVISVQVEMDEASIQHEGETYEWGNVYAVIKRAGFGVDVDTDDCERPHPHVSVGRLCLGSWSGTLYKMWKARNWTAFLTTAYMSACSYSPEGAFFDHRLGDRSQCATCDETINSDDSRYSCDRCANAVCGDCICITDKGHYCSACARWCNVCEEYHTGAEYLCYAHCLYVCDNCTRSCDRCSRNLCVTCAPEHLAHSENHGENLCSACREICAYCGDPTPNKYVYRCQVCHDDACEDCAENHFVKKCNAHTVCQGCVDKQEDGKCPKCAEFELQLIPF